MPAREGGKGERGRAGAWSAAPPSGTGYPRPSSWEVSVSPPTLFTDRRLRSSGQRVELPESERSHLRALRLRPGAGVRVTDGEGALWTATLERKGRERPAVRLEEEVPAPPPLPVELAFGVANRKRTLWLVEKAVELGALALQPVEFARSRSVADAARGEAFREKARRRAVSALKQCGGALLPDLRPASDLQPYLAHARALEGPGVLLEGEAGLSLRRALEGWGGEPPARVLLGPEGGLTEEERGMCREAGYRSASLGRRVLRFETAAVAALTVVGQQVEASGAGDGDGGDLSPAEGGGG